MTYKGHCNCASITVDLPKKPEGYLACHCKNCRRAGGPFSINYIVPENELQLSDANGTLRVYGDKQTQSGNTVQRSFCGGCGSPVHTASPAAPGQLFLKASLFDEVQPLIDQAFTERAIHSP